MIKISRSFDLGNDKSRIKDYRDAQRQVATVKEILKRFFNANPEMRYEIQILADEVGMGKTFVALATAFSILEAIRNGTNETDLDGCYQRVLIITPPNQALFAKWVQEVGEFVKRCVILNKDSATRLFKPVPVGRIDELVAELRKPGIQPDVILTSMNIFQGKVLRDYALKRRITLGLLFRFWGNRFTYDLRSNLLKGAPTDWPKNPAYLCDITDDEKDRFFFNIDEMYAALDSVNRIEDVGGGAAGSLENLRILCKEIAQPYTRGRQEQFDDVSWRLTDLYNSIVSFLIRKSFPLVIVDEAHNWKNGPTQGANGFHKFVRFIAPHTRRVLLLTATPFQLRPDEMLEILKISDYIEPSTSKTASTNRGTWLSEHREKTVRPVLENSADTSKKFTREWARLPKRIELKQVTDIWNSEIFEKTKSMLNELAYAKGEINRNNMDHLIMEALRYVGPELRPFFQEALRLYTYNKDLSRELGAFVIRHRRRTEHRLFRVGNELYKELKLVSLRGDSHILHAAPGIDVRGDGELPHYLLMRCVTEMKKVKGRRGRSSLGSTLTGCYSTLMDSAEGHAVKRWLQDSPWSKTYLELLLGMVSKDQDPSHPKIRTIVEQVLENWRRGEKTLIFCFRVNTAQRLRDIIDKRIRDELDTRRQRCLGGEKQLEYLRSRITGRERDLVVLGLDRVLLSLFIYTIQLKLSNEVLSTRLKIDDYCIRDLARISLRYDIDIIGDRIDRVFLYRAIEHVLSKYIHPPADWPHYLKQLLTNMASAEWVSHPYGLNFEYVDDGESEERTAFDERGVHFVYDIKAEPSEAEVTDYVKRITEVRIHARQTGQIPVIDSYLQSPSLWLGATPELILSNIENIPDTITRMHSHIWSLTISNYSELDWDSRRKVFQALRRAILRNSVLLRLLPDRSDLEEATWGELLVNAFFTSLPGQAESMADRISIFLEDLNAASGSLSANNFEDGLARFALYEATRLRDQQFVALVKGSGGGDEITRRNRVFTGFNTPLLPEVLVCTQVGQEGIDLHRHCRHVIHYDLAWNPAVLEQRTGRADRIGSKTFRERDRAPETAKPFLEIAVPFLAGTYDERMYEELRLRAQVFEVLTGGDIASDNREGLINNEDDEGREGGYALLSLPENMVADLRVNLHIWKEQDHDTSL